MATISGYDSNSIQTLFSSLNTGKTSGMSDLLGINYADYASIRSGSYFKLLKNYYAETGEKDTTKKTSTATAKDSTKALARVEESAEKLKESADTLLKKGTDSVFTKTKQTDKDGKTTYDYDKDKIYKAVKSFVDDYNAVQKEAEDSKVKGVKTNADSMTRATKVNAKLLGELGITMDSDNKLSIDEKTFKEADMEKVKSLFQTTGSYGYQISAKASMVDYYAQNEASKSNTYNGSGMYTYNYNTGEIYSSTM